MANNVLNLKLSLILNKEIILQKYDNKLNIELKNTNVKYARKLDSTSYFIDK